MARTRPLKTQPSELEFANVVGWFMVGFQADPNHEYSFTVQRDGAILPETAIQENNPNCHTLFQELLADPNLHHVRFIQKTERDADGKPIEHDPFC